MNNEEAPRTTTDAGIPAPSDNDSLTVGPDGPILLQDHYLIQKMAQFNRERVPERVVHAKGSGAHGYFEPTEDVQQWTRADFLTKRNRRTPVFVRFSSVAGELGSADTGRDPRGFAIKFYTAEGNYDLVGNNTPIFFIRDPSKFSDFIHSQKRLPQTNLRDTTMQWDFWSLRPEAMHQVTFLMSDRGTPRSWRHMNGYGSHTYMWTNAGGDRFWVKYHFKTEQGIENFTASEAAAMAAEDPDHHVRDLYESLARGEEAVWRLEMQIMPFADAESYRFNPFDLTKVWPHSDYPAIPIGRLVLNRNPENYFAEVEQAAFEPANMVPGIGPSPDKMLLGRLFSYPDAHRYRIGTNYLQLPINRPLAPVHSYNKDGSMRFAHAGDQPVYAPNSMGGPAAEVGRFGGDPGWTVSGEMVREAYTLRRDDDDYSQAGALVRDVLSELDRDHLVSNVVGHMTGVRRDVQERAVGHWLKIDQPTGERIAAGLDLAVAGRI
ncbi:MAG TPA: catalase [Candidatus Nitrosotalea sp.]|nr:catalase [Candidatus Nitrosotalea sp.]